GAEASIGLVAAVPRAGTSGRTTGLSEQRSRLGLGFVAPSAGSHVSRPTQVEETRRTPNTSNGRRIICSATGGGEVFEAGWYADAAFRRESNVRIALVCWIA